MSEDRVTRCIERGIVRRSAAARDVQRDRGVTIVELLVSMTLLSTVGIAVLVSVAASARGAAVHREVASVQAQLASAGDHLMSTDSPFRSCADPLYRMPNPDVPGEQMIDSVAAREGVRAFYEEQVTTVISTDLRVTEVQFWDGTDERWSSVCWALFQGDRMQRITLEVIDADVGANTLDVVKRPHSSDEPTAGIVTPPPLGSTGSGGGGGGGSGSFVTNPCIEGCVP